jgi:hypothetical protein
MLALQKIKTNAEISPFSDLGRILLKLYKMQRSKNKSYFIQSFSKEKKFKNNAVE